MKPAPFAYQRPTTLDAAVAALAADEDAVVLAGGQTLVPMLNMRLARPSVVVDIAHIEGLSGISPDTSRNTISIGAMTRQAELSSDPVIRSSAPLLAKAIKWVGHAPTRARGTVGGTVANADAAAEIPLALVTLGGTISVLGPNGARQIGAADFFRGPMDTVRMPDEIVTSIEIPIHGAGVGFQEVATRQSDYAIASAAAVLTVNNGICVTCAAGLGGATGRPIGIDTSGLTGQRVTKELIASVAESASRAAPILAPPHTSETYCRRAAARLLSLALEEASNSASEGAYGA